MTRTAAGRRRRTAVCLRTTSAVVLLVAALMGAGCDRDTDDPASADPQTGLGATPAPTASGGEAAGGTGEAGGTSGYPDTARAYAEAVVDAWAAADLERLAELATAQVHDQIIQIPGPPPHDWTFIRCEDDAYCGFYNSDGDQFIMHVQPPALGEPHAVDRVQFTVTTYPDDHLDYLAEFVTAWQSGNTARMHQLARPEVVEVYQQRQPGPVTDYGAAGGGGGLAIVVVTGVGFEIETHIGTTLLGGPQALIQAVPET